MKRIYFLLFCLLFNANLFAQFQPSLIEAKLKLPPKSNIGETLIQIGETFLGLPYEGGTLEGPEEKLVCKLDAFDCYTFVENVMAISLVKRSNDATSDNYQKILQNLRYRNGVINGYASRIHYFSDWAKNAEKNKYLQDLSPILGVKMDKKIDFMSKHRNLYPAFAKDEKTLAEIIKMEENLAKKQLYYIKKEDFQTYESAIKDGDIIAFTSTIAGLDVNHEGFAVWKNGKLHFMHASLEKKKIIVSDETLYQYLMRIKKDSGVMVLRVN
ncbi:DUF1460 domain-containing protein [Lacihabitans sp. LS3-19]|uniref:N-acetylmuramoyl-L-alanine amidase-like domain-containing protein n=1 Tax=Lacihabitans sp. LS3-19 TaxID=2487335 RepID=UPI0020CB7105|nr:N-acetylmuramoyl-L-alanine amidase-like domain-containing protein [Lacihabitans sp. LS3-19]MCP9768703.1 DUF1460 domain-containing protein [Lacihabitans sp. LS3-19]